MWLALCWRLCCDNVIISQKLLETINYNNYEWGRFTEIRCMPLSVFLLFLRVIMKDCVDGLCNQNGRFTLWNQNGRLTSNSSQNPFLEFFCSLVMPSFSSSLTLSLIPEAVMRVALKGWWVDKEDLCHVPTNVVDVTWKEQSPKHKGWVSFDIITETYFQQDCCSKPCFFVII